MREAQDNSVVQVALERDVLTGVYEGGFKVWECAIDLIQYLVLNGDHQRWTSTTVVEAGCGVGLPAIHALRQGAARVYFQDLNREVLCKSTQPAVALNARSELELASWCAQPVDSVSVKEGCSPPPVGAPVAQFVAGDWDAWDACKLDPHGVDVILSTDTLYAKPQIIKLTHLLHRLLKREPASAMGGTGVLVSPCAYIAAKRYYFGTDGGTFTFEQVLKAMPPVVVEVGAGGSGGSRTLVLTSRTVHSIQDNASNIRDILCVTWTKQ